MRGRGRGRGEALGHRSPNVERIFEKNPPSDGACDFLAAQLGELGQQILLRVGELLGHVDVDLHQQVAPAAALQHRDAADP